MTAAIEVMVVAMLAIGCGFVLVGSLGLFKLSDFMTRLHGPTKSTTLGVGCILVASIGVHALSGDGLSLRELLVTAFLFITAPISAQLMARAALVLGLAERPALPQTTAGDDVAEAEETPARARDAAPPAGLHD